MKSEIDYSGGIFGGMKSTLGGFLLLGALFMFYSFFCMALVVRMNSINSWTLFLMAPFAVLFWPIFNILGAGCAGVFISGTIIWVSHSFVRDPDSRSKWGGILCILISLQCFLMALSAMTLVSALLYFVVTLSLPAVFWFVGDRISKRRIKNLEQQADELERQRLLGQRKVSPDEYWKRY